MIEEKKKPYYVLIGSATGVAIATLILRSHGITNPDSYVVWSVGGSLLAGVATILFVY